MADLFAPLASLGAVEPLELDRASVRHDIPTLQLPADAIASMQTLSTCGGTRPPPAVQSVVKGGFVSSHLRSIHGTPTSKISRRKGAGSLCSSWAAPSKQ